MVKLPSQVSGAYAAAFLIWGAASDQWLAAIGAALALELPRLTRRLFDVDARSFRMAWLLSLGLEWMLAINAWLELSRMDAVRSVLKWSPLALLPVVLASALARSPGIPVTEFLLFLRKRFTRPSMGGVPREVPCLDPFFPYLWVILLSASYLHPGRWFFLAAGILVAGVLVAGAWREGRGRAAVCWAVAAGLVGMAGSIGIMQLYRAVENAMYGRMQGGAGQELDGRLTRIGAVDEVKARKEILWWVRHEGGKVPEYLYEASYDTYDAANQFWTNGDREMRKFLTLNPAGHDGSGMDEVSRHWEFGGPGAGDGRCRVRGMAGMDFMVLPLTYDAGRVWDLPAFRMDRNGLGVVRADCARPVIDYLIGSSLQLPLRAPAVEARDLALSPAARKIVAKTTAELGLAGMPPKDAVARVQRFFAGEFSYTRKIKMATVGDFLDKTRRGHCEYFATGTVLLLRSAGVPARYHTGFALVETDAGGRGWRVRGSHAHAWATAWLDGRWQVMDNTPPDWAGMDDGQRGPARWLGDWWAEKWLAFQEWRATEKTGSVLAWLSPLLAGLAVLYTVVRLLMARKKSRPETGGGRAGPVYAGNAVASRWAIVLPSVEAAAGSRPRHLPTLVWIGGMELWPDDVKSAAARLAGEHNRLRFGGNARVADSGVAGESVAAEQRLRGYLDAV